MAEPSGPSSDGAVGGSGGTPLSPGIEDGTDGAFSKIFKSKKKAKDADDIPDAGAKFGVARGLKSFSENLGSIPDTQPPQRVNNNDPQFDLRYEYDLSNNKKRKAFVFVNMHFDERTKLNVRKAAQNDLIYYKEAFTHLGFEVIPHFDSTADEIWKTFTEYQKADHGNESCVVFAFSTHGDEDKLEKKSRGYAGCQGECRSRDPMEKDVVTDVIYAKDGVIYTKELIENLSDKKCRSMAGKPKLFFFQACRGQMLDEVLEMVDDTVMIQKYHTNSEKSTVVDVPLKKDFFIAYSAPPGYFSFRRTAARSGETGSWFVIALHNIIMKHGYDYDLLDLLTMTTNSIAHDPEYKFKNKDEVFNSRRIVPYVSSMLLKTVRFRRD